MGAGEHGFSAWVEADDLIRGYDATLADISDPMPAPGAGPNALAAPQAALISAIAQGVLGGNLDWGLIGLGAMIGVGVIIVDEILRAAKRGSLPPLAVGMGR